MQNRVEELRKNAGYSRDRLAQILGVSGNTIINWENGGSIKSGNILQMTALFDCSINALLGLPEEDAVCTSD